MKIQGIQLKSWRRLTRAVSMKTNRNQFLIRISESCSLHKKLCESHSHNNSSSPDQALYTTRCFVPIAKRCHMVATGVAEASEEYASWRHMSGLRWSFMKTPWGRFLLSHDDADSTSSHTLERDNLYRAAGMWLRRHFFPRFSMPRSWNFQQSTIVVTVSLKTHYCTWFIFATFTHSNLL